MKKFLSDVELFLLATGLTPSAFGRLAARDKAFVSEIRAGRRPRLDTVERVEKFMREWKPPLPEKSEEKQRSLRAARNEGASQSA